jgi:lipopolysaccharide transport system ATP-binding protein
MSEIILKVENVSKQYQLGTFGTKTIGGDVHRWWTTNVLGKEDPFLKVGEVNDRTSKEKAEFVWALKDINFEVKRGEVLGIIGKNGAGKSTLLKLLSRVTGPTTGSIKSAGRMASLLEVGTGFHPELTGLENIYLNGAILGMSKSEIKRKLDEIIDFSGCGLYIDTPVKRYSSGMKVRLGFAVAAFLDPEILVVDEVLAVGDAEFQKKAIGKMKDVSKAEGRTVLFVSHNLSSIKALCTNSILLENGQLTEKGSNEYVIGKYLGNKIVNHKFNVDDSQPQVEGIKVTHISIINDFGEALTFCELNGDLRLKIEYRANNFFSAGGVIFSVSITNNHGDSIIHVHSDLKNVRLKKIQEKGCVEIYLYRINLLPGTYFITVGLVSDRKLVDYIKSAISFEVINTREEISSDLNSNQGLIYIESEWKI